MPQVSLAAEIYRQAQDRAAASGFSNVDDYVTELLANDFRDGDDENFDHLVTPERMEIINRAIEDLDAGNGIPIDEAFARLDGLRAAWLAEHPEYAAPLRTSSVSPSVQ